MHTHASWDGEQCCRRKFSFSSHQKAIFYFPSTKNGRFCEATTKWLIQNSTTTFYKNTRPSYMDNITTGDLKPFLPPLVEKANSCRIGRKWVRYELQVHDTMLMIFYKNNFRFTICYFIKNPMQVERGLARAKNLHARCSTKFDNS